MAGWNEKFAQRGHGFGASGNGIPNWGLQAQLDGFYGFGDQMNNAMGQMAALNLNNAKTVSQDRQSYDNVQQAALPAYAAANAQVESARINAEMEKMRAQIAADTQRQKTDAFSKLFSALTGAVAPAFQGLAQNNPYQPAGQGGFNDHYRRLAAAARGAAPGQINQMRGPAAFDPGAFDPRGFA